MSERDAVHAIPTEAPGAGLPDRIGKYEIAGVLGRGAMGIVYLARDPLLHREIALKVMNAAIAGDTGLKARFEREARAAARLSHPGIVTIYDLGYDAAGAPYIAMERLEGYDLRRHLREGPSMTLERKVSVVLRVLAGLSHAHRAGIVHRDIKPANIFIASDGSVRLLDFGMARLARGSVTAGGIMGTADYMSPEQVQGAPVDGRSDLFSCGAVLYEVLAGRPPFHVEDLVAIVFKIIHEEPDFGLISPDAAHAPLLPILRKALAKPVEERYRTAHEFALELGRSVGFLGAASIPLFEELLKLEAPAPPGPDDTTPHGARRADVADITLDLRSPTPVPATGRTWKRIAPSRRVARELLRLGVLAALVGAAAAGFLLRRGTPHPVAPPVEPAAEATPRRTATGDEGRPLFRPWAPLENAGAHAPATGNVAPSQPQAPATAQPQAAATAPPQATAVRGRWKGYVTDEKCRKLGGVPDHARCLEICLRKGLRPMLYAGGILYWLSGVERIPGDRDGQVVVEGWLDPATNTISVAEGPRR